MIYTGNYVIGTDMGGSGGKMAAGYFDGKKFHALEYFQIPNRPVMLLDTLYWDIFDLYRSILEKLSYCGKTYGKAQSIGFDFWGASYGFLDEFGRLAEPVYHYRDKRTENAMEALDSKITQREIFELTGCQPNRTYTLPQLYSSALRQEKIIERAKTLLFLPDLFAYFFSGEISIERTIAGTSSLLLPNQSDWSKELFTRLRIPSRFLTVLVDSGTVKGRVISSLGEQTGIGQAQVVAVPGHDTASAIAAIPSFGENQLYLSIGTNINMGIECGEPIKTEKAFLGGFKNTGGLGNKIIVYRDIPAFWLISLIMEYSSRKGKTYNFDEIEQLARTSQSIGSIIDIEDVRFSHKTEDVWEILVGYLFETKQEVPKTMGEMLRCIFESMALKVKSYSDYLVKEMGIPLRSAIAVNGGTRNTLIMELICDALGLPLRGGMPFGTLDGNMLSQLYALGELSGLEQMREVAERSFEMKEYEPRNTKMWEDKLQKSILMGICVGK